jgi:hypothetical protein
LVCFIIITFKNNADEYIQTPTPNVDVNNQGGRVVQIAPNRVGVIDNGNGSGWERHVDFEFNPNTEKFIVISSLPYEDIFNHQKDNGIPIRDDKY